MMELVVITPARWLYNELKHAGSSIGVDVTQDHGYGDFIEPQKAVWGSMHFIMRQAPQHSLLDAGSGFLPSLPYEYTQRNFEITTIKNLRTRTDESSFYKLANLKLDNVEGTSDRDEFLACFDSHKYTSESTEVLISGYKDFIGAYEFRSFICKGKVKTTCYMDSNGYTWNAEGFTMPADSILEAAQVFTQDVVSYAETIIPSGFVVDVALLSSGEFVVIEGNPVWCSNPYFLSTDPHTVMSIIEGQGDENSPYQWKPDPTLQVRADMFKRNDYA